MYYIGIDLGGTNIAVGICDEDKKIIGRASCKTKLPRPAEEICEDMVATAKAAMKDAGITSEQVKWAGVGAPGSIDPKKGIIIYANNLGFNNVEVVRLVEQGLGVKTYIENDANAAAYGEALAGAARGVDHAVAVTLGTGVGGGIIIDRKIYTGFNYAGAELGHMVIEQGGWECTCGRMGCWEAYSSATGLIKMTRNEMQRHPDSLMWDLCENKISKVSGKTACDALRAGDHAAKLVFDKYLDYLACGITNIINIFQPEVLCIGGGISREGDFLLTPLKKLVFNRQYTRSGIPQTKLVIAELGNDAGIIGAAFLGLNK